jgi:hypothetical protein
MDRKQYLSKHTRENGGVPFALTERDLEILRAVNRYRYLKTGQINRLLFSECKTQQSTRRRLKYLFHNKFIGRIMPLTRMGDGSSEIIYFLDKAGEEYLQESEEAYVYTKAGQVGHMFLNHALDLSEFRLNLEQALKAHSIVSLQTFIADFEIRHPTQGAVGNKIYKLYDEVFHQVEKKRYIVYPDALLLLQGKGEYESHKKLYFVEIDRGTEGFKIIKEKITGYRIYTQRKIFQKYGQELNKFSVLLQTNSEKRAENLRHELNGWEGAELVWITHDKAVNEKTILSAPIWRDYDLNYTSILKT